MLYEFLPFGKVNQLLLFSHQVVSTQLCDHMNCKSGGQRTGSSVHGISPHKNTGVGCHFLLQGISPTQGLNLCLLMADGLFTAICIRVSLLLWISFPFRSPTHLILDLEVLLCILH